MNRPSEVYNNWPATIPILPVTQSTAPSHRPPGLLLFERTSRWEVRLRRELAGEPVWFDRVTRPSVESNRFGAHPQPGARRSVWILVLVGAEASVMQFLSDRYQRSAVGGRTLPIIVIGTKAHRSLEWILRELGTDCVLEEPFAPESLVRTLRWFWQFSSSQPA